MEITKENFNDKLNEILEAIKRASVISIDTEFTGLLTDDRLKRSYFDSGAEVYAKERENLKNVTICQFGLSALIGSIDQNGYQTKTYNFYIMPKALLGVDPSITCQSSSVEFLMQVGFDFRKWLLNGIPCLNDEGERAVRKEFKEMLSDDYNQHLPLLVLDQLAIVDAWRQKAVEDDKELSVFLRLPSFILHFMAAIYRRYNDVTLSLDADEVKLCYVGKDHDKESLLTVIESAFESIISENRGFVKVFQELTKDKTIVFHNGMKDLTLMFKQFHKSLPNDYNEFKNEIHELFPTIFDTKRLARMVAQKYKRNEQIKNLGNFLSNSSLEAIKMELDNCSAVPHRPIISHSPLTPKYGGPKSHYHEAGYDAFCTAYCFLNLAHIYQMFEDTANCGLVSRPLSAAEHIGAVSQWRNQIPIQNGGISYVVLDGDNPPLNSMDWMVVRSRKMFSPLTTSHLNKLFAPWGRFEVHELGNGAFLVASFRKKAIMQAFRNHELIHISNYSAMKHSTGLRRLTLSAALLSSGMSAWLMCEGIKLIKQGCV